MMTKKRFLLYVAVGVIVLYALTCFRINPHSWRHMFRASNRHSPNRPLSTQREKEQPDVNLIRGYSQTLTVRMAATPKLIERLYCTMLRSAALFWSHKLGPITLILDKESKKDQELAASLREQENSLGMKFNFQFEPLPSDPTVLDNKRRSPAYSRQLWSFFFMDLYINASIVALTDTDGMFSTPVTPENIFNGDKLRVIGMDWRRVPWNDEWAKTTQIAIGKKMVVDFMDYFPSYIWRSTITNCRNHIIKHLNVSTFGEAFNIFYAPHLAMSPICIVMSYAYYFEYERYDWHLDVSSLYSYSKERLSPGFFVNPRDTLPDIHVSTHESYFSKKLPNPMRQGYCVAKRHVDTMPASCKEFQNVTNFQLFVFSTRIRPESPTDRDHLNTWCAKQRGREHCKTLIDSHYQNVRKYHRAGWYDLDLSRVFAVERAATEVNVTCPKVFNV